MSTSVRRRIPVLPAALVAALLLGCGPSRPEPGGPEEIATAVEDVPAVVQVTAARIAERLGGAQVGDWSWDTESDDWECALLGLSRTAELDVGTDGRFHELELVYELAEVEEQLPDAGAFIRGKCKDDRRVVIELSLRREELLDPVPSLAEAWRRSGVVLEFQCANGRDFEFDARNLVEESPVDDRDG